MKIYIYIIGFSLSLIAFSQKSLYDYAIQDDKEFFKDTFIGSDILDDFDRDVRKGEIAKNVIDLKKVGLLTFYLFETNFKKEKAHIVYQHSTDGKSIVQTIYESSLDILKDSLKQNGIDLLSPDEYLVTEPSLDAYKTAAKKIQVIASKKIGLEPALEKYGSNNTPSTINYMGTTVDEGKNGEVLNVISELTKTLGLDGMMTVQIVTEHFNYAIAFKSLTMEMYIPHPKPNTKKDIYGYRLGNYSYICQDSRGFVGIKKDEVTGEDYSAFPHLIARSGADFINFLKTELNILFDI